MPALALLRIASRAFDTLAPFRSSEANRILQGALRMSEGAPGLPPKNRDSNAARGLSGDGVIPAEGSVAWDEWGGGLLDIERAFSSEGAAAATMLYAAAGERTEKPSHAKARLAALRLRRDAHNGRRLRTADVAAAREILDPGLVSHLEQYSALRDRSEALLAEYQEAFERDLLRSRRALLASATADPLVEEGIFLASRSLLPGIRALAGSDPGHWSHAQRHDAAKLAAYISRFATKTSPNGVFCAVTLAPLEGTAAVVEGEPVIGHVEVLVSVSEARKVTACLANEPGLAPAIVPRPNPTLREGDGAWTFWKPATFRQTSNEEILSRAKDHPIMRLFIEEAGRAVHSVPALISAVAARCGAAAEELAGFYEALVERGILIGEIEVPYSARRPFRILTAAAHRAGYAASWVGLLEQIEETIDTLPKMSPGARIEAMARAGRLIATLPHVRPLEEEALFRVDAASALRAQLPRRVEEDLRAPIRAFILLLAGMYPEDLNTASLVQRFLKDHPADTEVEFLELYRGFVDRSEEPGRPLEFPDPVETPAAEGRLAEAHATARRVVRWFADKARASEAGAVVEVDEETVRTLVGGTAEPRWSSGVLVQIAACSLRDIEEDRYQMVLSALFNGTGIALARFAHLLGKGLVVEDNPVARALHDGWSALGRPGAVLAELTYNHDGRTANAGLRPVLFGHEIELPGERSSPGVESIPLRDLTIRYDSRGGRLVLRSASRGVEVVPVLTSGVNPVGIVSDLVHIGRQGWQSVGYLPGFQAADVTRWPRFTCGKLVLFRARWIFRGAGIPPSRTGAGPLSDADFFLAAARWRDENALPRHVFVHTVFDPKPFYVDLEAPLLVDLLRRAVAGFAGKEDAVLYVTEMLPAPDQMWIEDARGRYATELLVQLDGSVSS